MSRIIYVVPQDGAPSPSFDTYEKANAYIEQVLPCENKHDHYHYWSTDSEDWPTSVPDTLYQVTQTRNGWRMTHHLPTDAMGCEWVRSRGGYVAEVTVDD